MIPGSFMIYKKPRDGNSWFPEACRGASYEKSASLLWFTLSTPYTVRIIYVVGPVVVS